MAHKQPTEKREIDTGYIPRPQFDDYHDRTQRWGCIVAHRRFGKTVGCVHDLIEKAVECDKPDPRFAYIAPTFSQAKDVAWNYLKKYGLCFPGASEHESELRIDFPHNGARIRLYGSDNYDRMRGIYLDGVVNDEYGDQDPRAWTEVLRPALSDRKGWATFIGTPRGDNHFKEMYDRSVSDPDWFSLMLKASQTGMIDEQELADARRQLTAEQYAAEYECSFYGSVLGAYYGEAITIAENAGYIGDYDWDPSLAVCAAFDVGKTTAIWLFQLDGSRVRIIDYIEAVGGGAEWVAKELKSRPYVYDTFIIPSDADDEKELVGKSWREALEGFGFYKFVVLPKQRSINDGINEARLLFPRCRFDSKAANGVAALRNYRSEWDDKRKVFRETPRHDWASHGADAFRYLAIGIVELTGENFGGVGAGRSDWGTKISYTTKRV